MHARATSFHVRHQCNSRCTALLSTGTRDRDAAHASTASLPRVDEVEGEGPAECSACCCRRRDWHGYVLCTEPQTKQQAFFATRTPELTKRYPSVTGAKSSLASSAQQSSTCQVQGRLLRASQTLSTQRFRNPYLPWIHA